MPQWVFPPTDTPRRKRLDALLEGIGEGLSMLGQYGMKRSLIREEAQGRASVAGQGQAAALIKEFREGVAKGDYEPEQAQRLAAAQGLVVPRGYFETAAPSNARVTSGLMESIGKAPTLEQTPSDKAILGSVPRRMKVMPLTPFDSPSRADTADPNARPSLNVDTGETMEPYAPTGQPTLPSRQMQPGTLPDLQAILDAASGKRGSFIEKTEGAVGPTGEKGVLRQRSSDIAASGGGFTPTERNPMVEGIRAGQQSTTQANTESAAKLPELKGAMKGRELTSGELSPGVTAAKTAAENALITGTTAAKAGQAYATSRASDQAAFDVKTSAANVARDLAIKGGLPDAERSAVMQLAGDFATASKDFFTRQEAFRRIAELGSAANHTNASDYALSYAFATLNDPQTGVRDAERQDLRNLVGVPDRIRNALQKAISGQLLDDKERADIVGQAATIYRTGVAEHNARVQDFTIRQRQLAPHGTPEMVVRNPALDMLTKSQNIGGAKVGKYTVREK